MLICTNFRLYDCLEDMLSETLDYAQKQYINDIMNNQCVYYENRITGKVHEVDCQKTLKDIVSEEK
jgi:hypothetical protein